MVESVLCYFTEGIKAGRTNHLTPTVADLLGRPARTLEQWARDHRAALG